MRKPEAPPTAPKGNPTSKPVPERLLMDSAPRAATTHTEEALAFSIPEFCRRHGTSRAHLYNLWKSG